MAHTFFLTLELRTILFGRMFILWAENMSDNNERSAYDKFDVSSNKSDMWLDSVL